MLLFTIVRGERTAPLTGGPELIQQMDVGSEPTPVIQSGCGRNRVEPLLDINTSTFQGEQSPWEFGQWTLLGLEVHPSLQGGLGAFCQAIAAHGKEIHCSSN